ncbi:DNA polymerase III subunit chi [Nitrosomonas sp.]|uniref:DNA polymerase III subunit chi n=1 Tax=Nitrosomonas sp. TaxID=42353 RepID=UPI0025E9928B|nr:DNA polymerase III subunit chi [Nitrosomonas sp.]MBY0483720.1 DNA polymerase III subunit chi [Nitrosomonas sp.]
MTQIYFYSGSNDKLQTACRLCAKAAKQNMKIMAYSPDATVLEQFNELLWTFSPTSFIPHCTLQDDPQLLNVTPVILSGQIPPDSHYDVLLNLHQKHPPLFNIFNRIIEIAGVSHKDKLVARERYRFYKDAGYEIQHFNLD